MKIIKKNIRLSNACISVNCEYFKTSGNEEQNDENFLQTLIDLDYCSYIVFQREISCSKGDHWQLYVEFKHQVYLTALEKDMPHSYIAARKASQRQAINQCKKKGSEFEKIYEWGVPKKHTRRQRFIKEKKETKKDEDKAIQNRCKTIWIFGKTGSGKSTWTYNYLYESGWKDQDVVYIGKQNMFQGEKILFFNEHKKCSVLVISEVDKEFPLQNNLINFIDNHESLLTRQGKSVDNNFELIIINSLYKPEEVFALPICKDLSMQIIRGIYDESFGIVQEIKANKKQLKELKQTKKRFSNVNEFMKWYKPKIVVHKKPSYALLNGKQQLIKNKYLK